MSKTRTELAQEVYRENNIEKAKKAHNGEIRIVLAAGFAESVSMVAVVYTSTQSDVQHYQSVRYNN